MFQRKKKGLYMFVRDTNKDAINLYKKLGFSSVKKYTLKDGEYVIMAKGNADKSPAVKHEFLLTKIKIERMNTKT